ncbi:uncharacterized protein LTR77_000531 [Saxophila tyrrhenica]|uniref:Uncharacterized protein n=1 Tax=Saxophila tyrrhenica TaxID=1690608 RepID=A0AAV9PRG7_9PEZI|nr:hypothetical protein LTR77_000531 [Saxophila tyrrhenica]
MNGLGDLGPGYGQHYTTEEDPYTWVGELPGIAGWRCKLDETSFSSITTARLTAVLGIFIMQGLLTIVVGFIGFVTIVDFPENAASNKAKGLSLPFLNQKEADFIVARIERDRHDAIAAPFSMKEYMKCAADLKIWGFASLFGLTTTVTYAIAYFLPIILQEGMGFGIAAAQCLIAPPYVLAAIWMYACAVLGDRMHLRGPFVIGNGVMALIGLPLLGFADNVGARYFGVFLATTAVNANVPCILTFQANNIRGQWKRALASATLVGTGGIGGIVGSTVFRSEDVPAYVPGIMTCMIASGLVIVITLMLEFKFWRANKRAAAGGKIIAGLEGFRYTY